MTLRLRLLDTVFEIRTEEDDVAALLGRLWEPFATSEDAPADAAFTIERDGSELAVGERGGEPLIRHPDVWGLTDALRYRMLELAEAGLERAVSLHAAAVALDGRLLLLAGPSGAGKTTLTLGLLRAGWTYFSDDVAPVDRATAAILPFPKPLGVKDPALFDGLASAYAGLDLPRPPKAFLVPASTFPVGREALPASVLVFPAFRPGAAPSAAPLTAAKATALATPFVRRLDPEVLGLLNRVCGGCDCFDLVYGSTAGGIEAVTSLVGGAAYEGLRSRDS
ncbi:MAG: hypothetical protein M3323_09820 [Actinomycetota bacterium]|nr:hypothetical protein [Actinomycetota bacterium]